MFFTKVYGDVQSTEYISYLNMFWVVLAFLRIQELFHMVVYSKFHPGPYQVATWFLFHVCIFVKTCGELRCWSFPTEGKAFQHPSFFVCQSLPSMKTYTNKCKFQKRITHTHSLLCHCLNEFTF